MPLVHQKLGGVTVHLAQPLTLSLSYYECEFVCLFVTVLIAFFVKKQSGWLNIKFVKTQNSQPRNYVKIRLKSSKVSETLMQIPVYLAPRIDR